MLMITILDLPTELVFRGNGCWEAPLPISPKTRTKNTETTQIIDTQFFQLDKINQN
jgi:hypothetical protein